MSSVPKLRFREFKSDWANCRLIDVAELQRGFDLPSANRVEGIVPIVSSGGITGFHCEPKVQPPGIVMGRYGSIGEVFYVEQPFWPLNTTLWVKDFKENLPKFAYYLLSTIDYSRYSDKTGVPGVNRNDLHIIKVGKPDGSEQQKIAAFLTAVDTKIEQLTQKEALLKQYKKGVMQKIFSQEIRFKADDGSEFPEWEERKFGEVFERITTKNKENNQNVLTISAQQGLVNQEDYFNKSVAAQDVTGYYLLHKDDFAYNKSYSKGYPLGAIKRLTKYEKGVVSTLYICFRSKNCVTAFAEQFFENGGLNREIHKIAQEGARNHGLLNMSVVEFFKDIEMPLPCREEQLKIAELLANIDSKIGQATEQLTSAKIFKKGLLQQMFV